MSDISPLKYKSAKSPSKRSQRPEDSQKDLLQGFTEKEVEIEHLKTIIVAQKEQMTVIDSVKEDI